jgi:hypothetical protein
MKLIGDIITLIRLLLPYITPITLPPSSMFLYARTRVRMYTHMYVCAYTGAYTPTPYSLSLYTATGPKGPLAVNPTYNQPRAVCSCMCVRVCVRIRVCVCTYTHAYTRLRLYIRLCAPPQGLKATFGLNPTSVLLTLPFILPAIPSPSIHYTRA